MFVLCLLYTRQAMLSLPCCPVYSVHSTDEFQFMINTINTFLGKEPWESRCWVFASVSPVALYHVSRDSLWCIGTIRNYLHLKNLHISEWVCMDRSVLCSPFEIGEGSRTSSVCEEFQTETRVC